MASPIYGTGVLPIAKNIVNSDSTNLVDLYDNSAGTQTKRVEALNICSDNDATTVVKLWHYTGSTAYLLGAVSVPTLSGTNGTAPRINALAILGTVESDGVPVIHVPAGSKLQASVVTAVTSAKTVTITGRARKYE